MKSKANDAEAHLNKPSSAEPHHVVKINHAKDDYANANRAEMKIVSNAKSRKHENKEAKAKFQVLKPQMTK